MSNSSNSSAIAEATVASVNKAMAGRLFRDRAFKWLMSGGGIAVLACITAIFFYLASVVVPLFLPPTVEAVQRYAVPGDPAAATGDLSGEEQRQFAARSSLDGRVTYFRLDTGEAISNEPLPLPPGVRVSSFGAGERSTFAVSYGLSDGRALAVRPVFRTSFVDGRREIAPALELPLGTAPVAVDPQGRALVRLAAQHTGNGSTFAALTEDGRLLVSGVTTTTNAITGATSSEVTGGEVANPPADIGFMLVDALQRSLYVVHGARQLTRWDIRNKAQPQRLETVDLVPEGERVTAVNLLSLGSSLIVGSDKGRVVQWFLVRTAKGSTDFRLQRIREFPAMAGGIEVITPEVYRKGFMVGDSRGNLGAYHATSQRQLFVRALGEQPIRHIAIPPRANAFIVQDAGGRVHTAHVENHYPEVSFSALWQKVWYETYDDPEYIWQSTSAVSEFEPKFSLAPLTFGTLKAAFYAMLVAVPLAILGAIFAAYFMAPKMRQTVKPTIELMEALPTVILGFLAGLWLAPFVESNLLGVLLAIFFLPFSFVAAAYTFSLLPEGIRTRVPPGWEAAILIPVIVVYFYAVFTIGRPLEALFFGGDMPYFMTNTLGITFEQRNSLVVGIAMGFAVTPTIFSIADDAIFGVPKSLTSGSLALGATPWQTLMGVVLLTASPGIFSAVMIGMGRAVGETMIVLMATGNTAVMDWSLFTGFRTLSANIGVEMPEAGVGETHYRLLFLSALVLFGFTFIMNTLAELVRQRLREKYSTI